MTTTAVISPVPAEKVLSGPPTPAIPEIPLSSKITGVGIQPPGIGVEVGVLVGVFVGL